MILQCNPLITITITRKPEISIVMTDYRIWTRI